MTTRADMIADIDTDNERGGADNAVISAKIMDAIRYYQRTRFYFNESRSVTLNTVAAQDTYTFPTRTTSGDIPIEFYRLDAVYVTQGTNVIPLRVCDYRQFETISQNAGNNLPVAFAYIDKALRLYPTPDQAYPLRLTGHLRIDGPAADGTADNIWMTDGYDLIKARATFLIGSQYWKDAETAAIAKGDEREQLSALLKAGSSRTGTGSIRPTQF